MLQLAEHGLAVGDLLPEFALPDTDGTLVSSGALLARGALVTAFIGVLGAPIARSRWQRWTMPGQR